MESDSSGKAQISTVLNTVPEAIREVLILKSALYKMHSSTQNYLLLRMQSVLELKSHTSIKLWAEIVKSLRDSDEPKFLVREA